MDIAFNYHNEINEPQADLIRLIKKINFYLSSNFIAKICRRLGALKRVRKDVIELNKKLKDKNVKSFALYFAVKEKYNDIVDNDVLDIIIAIQKQIDTHLFLKEGIDAFIIEYGYNKIDFRTTQHYINQMLELDYKMITFFKKANKKVARATSDLAQQSSTYSLQNLSEILNAR